MARRALARCLASLALAAPLAGCGLLSEEAVVAPGKFAVYNCAQLEQRGRELSVREQELQELTQRAAQSAGGEIIGAIAYRTELLQTRGQLKLIAETATQKNCASQSQWQSGRAVW